MAVEAWALPPVGVEAGQELEGRLDEAGNDRAGAPAMALVENGAVQVGLIGVFAGVAA